MRRCSHDFKNSVWYYIFSAICYLAINERLYEIIHAARAASSGGVSLSQQQTPAADQDDVQQDDSGPRNTKNNRHAAGYFACVFSEPLSASERSFSVLDINIL